MTVEKHGGSCGDRRANYGADQGDPLHGPTVATGTTSVGPAPQAHQVERGTAGTTVKEAVRAVVKHLGDRPASLGNECSRYQPGHLRDLQPFTSDIDKPVMLVSEGAVSDGVAVSLVAGPITNFCELPEGHDRDLSELPRLLGH
ncbi:hypothetical protein [Streptomyces sp. NPDC098781]|uniref:hypothetical protein n=1 Tax=Streptomyces sp. NPDC098781 TaxID=3366097 RepID=UPI003803A2AD